MNSYTHKDGRLYLRDSDRPKPQPPDPILPVLIALAAGVPVIAGIIFLFSRHN